jgi:hypothetical protein
MRPKTNSESVFGVRRAVSAKHTFVGCFIDGIVLLVRHKRRHAANDFLNLIIGVVPQFLKLCAYTLRGEVVIRAVFRVVCCALKLQVIGSRLSQDCHHDADHELIIIR